jgi:hypothetical protein
MRSDNPRARAAMRMSVIDKRDAPERQRVEAINSLTDNNMTPDDAVYLRGLFKRQGESDRIKDAIVSAIGRVPNEENLKFLMDVAQDPNESSSIRANALPESLDRQPDQAVRRDGQPRHAQFARRCVGPASGAGSAQQAARHREELDGSRSALERNPGAASQERQGYHAARS